MSEKNRIPLRCNVWVTACLSSAFCLFVIQKKFQVISFQCKWTCQICRKSSWHTHKKKTTTYFKIVNVSLYNILPAVLNASIKCGHFPSSWDCFMMSSNCPVALARSCSYSWVSRIFSSRKNNNRKFKCSHRSSKYYIERNSEKVFLLGLKSHEI